MHGIRQSQFYTTPEEKEKYEEKLKKGYELLDKFVDFASKTDVLATDDNVPLVNGQPASEWMFELSNAIIEFMPEFTLSWDYRKRFLLHRIKLQLDLPSVLLEERHFSEKILRTSPKCYAVWHHRLWLITIFANIGIENLKQILTEEFMLCMKLFKYDARNFHCWGYLNFIRQYVKYIKDEVFTEYKFNKMCWAEFERLVYDNFSNYSAWHQRSYLSPGYAALADELELLKQAIYTDPNDQTLWYYHDWLLYNRNALKYHLVGAHYNTDNNIFTFYFNQCIKPEKPEIKIASTNAALISTDDYDAFKPLQGVWKAVNGHCFAPECTSQLPLPQYVWQFMPQKDQVETFLNSCIVFDFTFEQDDATIFSNFYSHLLDNEDFNINGSATHEPALESSSCVLKLSYKINVVTCGQLPISHDVASCTVWQQQGDKWIGTDLYAKPLYLSTYSEFVCVGYQVDDKVLQEQLDMVEDLMKMEPNVVAILQARAKLLRVLDRDYDFQDLSQQLSSLDPFRASRYQEMATQIASKRRINNHDGLNLSGLGIERLSYFSLSPWFYFRTLDLSDNSLTNASLVDLCLPQLLFLRDLNLSGNRISDVTSLFTLLKSLKLRRLNLARNPIPALSEELFSVDFSICEIKVSNTPLAEFLISEACDSKKNGSEGFKYGHFGVCFAKKDTPSVWLAVTDSSLTSVASSELEVILTLDVM